MSEERTARPKVSVIVPIYKVEKYLVRCLESVTRQTLEELEIILLDEGEPDRCREIIDFYEQCDPRVVAIHEPNPGASYGAKVNRGLDRATGEFVAIVEPDDFIGPEMYEQMYECAVRTGANIVKTPYYNYVSKEDNAVDKSRGYINANVPKEKPFSIFQFPQLLAIHPSVWSAIYRREALKEYGVRCVEAPGAGYVDNGFYLDAYVKLGKIVWLNKPFYRWRISSEVSSSAAEHWDRCVMLRRWTENLDRYPPEAEENSALVAGFANKAWTSVFRHYLEGWEYNEQEYGELTAFLRRFTQEQLMSALRVSEEHREQMTRCRNDPEGFRAEYFPETPPEPEPEPEKKIPEKKAPEKKAPEKKVKPARKAVKRTPPPPTGAEQFWSAVGGKYGFLGVFGGGVYLLLTAIALKAGAFGRLAPDGAPDTLSTVCAGLSALCVPGLVCCGIGRLWAKKRRRKRLATGRQLYICSTFYHVYVTLLKQLAKARDADMVVCSDIPGGKALAKRLTKTGLFRRVWYVKQYGLPKDEGTGAIDRALFQHRRRYRKLTPLLPFDLADYEDVYIFHDATPLGMYLNDARRPYHLVEDGLNFYQFIRQTVQVRFLKPHDLSYRVRKLFDSGYFPLGESRHMIDLEVNEDRALQVRAKRVREVPRAPLIERLTEEDKELLLRVFDCPDFSQLQPEDTALVLTDALCKDKVCASEEEQLDVYRQMIRALEARGYRVVLKPHPRDKADYSPLCETVLPKEFPVELFSFFPEIVFAATAAVISTAVKIVPAKRRYKWAEGKLKEIICEEGSHEQV